MKRIFSLCLILCVLLFAITVVSAKTWVEDFNTASFDSWTKHDPENRSTWQPKDGRLDVWIQPPPPPANPVIYALEFTGFHFQVETLNVKVKILECRNAAVGIFIGQYNGQGDKLIGTFSFLHEHIWNLITVIPAPIGLGIDFRLVKNANRIISASPGVIEISFNKGDLEVFAKGKSILKHRVPQLPTINCIGMLSVVSRGDGVVAHIVLDNFVISGPNVPLHGTLNVRPKGKAAVLWGELKGQ